MVLAGDLGARIAAVASRYELTPAFVRAYLAPRSDIRGALEAATDEADLFARLGPLNEMYVRFALSTTLRGRTFVEYVAPYIARPARFLDIGCAYGGFLRAWRERGVAVVGVEIEPEFASLARENLSGGPGEVVQADILACDPTALGAFDVVACNDVIEHVADARSLVDRVRALLAPGGIAYFEIPNPDAIAFVARDGHFQQFGLTLLPRPLAERYLHDASGRSYREMGELHDEATYRRWFDAAGLLVLDTPQPHAQRFDELHDRVFELVNAFTWWYGHQRSTLSPEVANAVTDRYWTYAAALFAAAERARRSIDRSGFERRYLSPFWTFVVRRN
jgi:2-polyprenyl-3-methyl-5-hydroxy-6-metoxy-1,4-benzoquinol methylase